MGTELNTLIKLHAYGAAKAVCAKPCKVFHEHSSIVWQGGRRNPIPQFSPEASNYHNCSESLAHISPKDGLDLEIMCVQRLFAWTATHPARDMHMEASFRMHLALS